MKQSNNEVDFCYDTDKINKPISCLGRLMGSNHNHLLMGAKIMANGNGIIQPKWYQHSFGDLSEQELLCEKWKDVVGLEGVYKVSNLGRVSRIKGREGSLYNSILKPKINKDGYHVVNLYNHPNPVVTGRIHRLVYTAFVGPIPDGLTINHIDGKKTNNKVFNLEAITHADNMRHAALCGLVAKGESSGSILHPETRARGERNGQTKITDEDVVKMRKLRESGYSCKALCEMHKMHHSCISRITRHLTWGHVV